MNQHLEKIRNLLNERGSLKPQEKESVTNAIKEIEKHMEIESALEKVRIAAMAMKQPADMLHVCRTISDQCQQLGFREIRNVQTVIIYEHRHQYLNYQYFTPYDQHS